MQLTEQLYDPFLDRRVIARKMLHYAQISVESLALDGEAYQDNDLKMDTPER